ncbi:hypothetical protein AVEN_99626-1 [Araneus ventricosus]|uniref:Uncharacterized protein n=1 Tax=Araneus ventricosus TaxID=182803 RepID=A0A4Y2VEN9_ARAVE|nr:hypothetical protein AVEN_99626-1 [Araneus ventricosus]
MRDWLQLLAEYKRAAPISRPHYICLTMNSVQYITLVDWMWLREKWLVRRIAFAPVYKPEDTLVIKVMKESWGFAEEPVSGRVYRVDLEDMATFLRGQFYHTILKEPDTWDITIGTKDMATFMFLDPLLRDKVVYLGEKVNVEEEVSGLIKAENVN